MENRSSCRSRAGRAQAAESEFGLTKHDPARWVRSRPLSFRLAGITDMLFARVAPGHLLRRTTQPPSPESPLWPRRSLRGSAGERSLGGSTRRRKNGFLFLG